MPMVMTPSLFTDAGTLAARAESTDDCGVTAPLSPPPDELPPQAARLSVAAMTSAGVRRRDRASTVPPERDGSRNILPGASVTAVVRAVTRSGRMAPEDTESPVFALHRDGKIEVLSTVPLRDRDDLSLAYTPGVA